MTRFLIAFFVCVVHYLISCDRSWHCPCENTDIFQCITNYGATKLSTLLAGIDHFMRLVVPHFCGDITYDRINLKLCVFNSDAAVSFLW